MTGMTIPAGYAVLTCVMVLLSIVALVRAGWARTVAAVLAALGFCVLTGIFVTDVISDGTAMNPMRAIISAIVAVVLMVPQGARVLRGRAVKARPARSANPPDAAKAR